ncbi:hypothetical protein [Bacillus sp. SM2101]|nr:hypothetical protein [Bacillus sp. SM2101]
MWWILLIIFIILVLLVIVNLSLRDNNKDDKPHRFPSDYDGGGGGI